MKRRTKTEFAKLAAPLLIMDLPMMIFFNSIKERYKNRKYKLSIWQYITLPLLWIYWFFAVVEKKKSWHEVKKGIEKHTCTYTVPFRESGYKFYRCNHEGCYMCIPDPIETEKMFNRFKI